MVDMKKLFEREILEGKARLLKSYEDAEAQYESLGRYLKLLKTDIAKADVKLQCNASDSHDFTSDDVSILGSRFEEVCKHCGFVNRV